MKQSTERDEKRWETDGVGSPASTRWTRRTWSSGVYMTDRSAVHGSAVMAVLRRRKR
ncbi:hypothetical protein Hanom_Chr07g00635401 [Helianthus anomalus]